MEDQLSLPQPEWARADFISGVFSTGATAPVILRKRLIAPAVSTHNGKILLTLSTLNIKIRVFRRYPIHYALSIYAVCPIFLLIPTYPYQKKVFEMILLYI